MTNKTESTIEELQRQVEELRSLVEKLSTDPSYEIMTRQAAEIKIPAVSDSIQFVAFLDIDYLHDLNSKIGHEEANNRIRRALRVRSTDLILSPVKWYSGDEVVLLLKGSPVEFCDRLMASFEAEGMSITIAAAPYSGNLMQAVEVAKREVFRQKGERGSSR